MKAFNEWLKENYEKDDIFLTETEVNDYIANVAKYLTENGKHYGDCTYQNVSCLICLFENELTRYYNYTKKEIK